MGLQLEGLIMGGGGGGGGGGGFFLPPPPPPPRRLLLDQTEKKFLDTAPSPSFLTGPDNRPPPPDPALRVCEVGFLTKEINVRCLHLRL